MQPVRRCARFSHPRSSEERPSILASLRVCSFLLTVHTRCFAALLLLQRMINCCGTTWKKGRQGRVGGRRPPSRCKWAGSDGRQRAEGRGPDGSGPRGQGRAQEPKHSQKQMFCWLIPLMDLMDPSPMAYTMGACNSSGSRFSLGPPAGWMSSNDRGSNASITLGMWGAFIWMPPRSATRNFTPAAATICSM